MKKISTREFNKLLCVLDEKNNFDFETFIEGIVHSKIAVDQGVLDNIVDYIVFDLGYTSDAQLATLNQVCLRGLLKGINNILSEGYTH